MSNIATAKPKDMVLLEEEQLVTMTVDGQLFGIPILRVQDIVEPSDITPVPLAPAAIAGVLNLRGRIVTVIDLRQLLGSSTPEDERKMGVTVERGGDLYTILVDTIGDVRSVAVRDRDQAPTTIEESIRRLCSGIVRLEDDLLVVLDIDRILDEETIQNTPATTRRRMTFGKRSMNHSDGSKKSSPAKEQDNDEPARADGARNGTALKKSGSAGDVKSSALPCSDTRTGTSAPKPANPVKAKAASPGQPFKSKQEITKHAGALFDALMSDRTVSHFVAESDRAEVKQAFADWSASLFGHGGQDVDDLIVVLELLVREQGLDDDHFIALGKHAHTVLNRAGVDSAAIDAVLTKIDEIREKVLPH